MVGGPFCGGMGTGGSGNRNTSARISSSSSVKVADTVNFISSNETDRSAISYICTFGGRESKTLNVQFRCGHLTDVRVLKCSILILEPWKLNKTRYNMVTIFIQYNLHWIRFLEWLSNWHWTWSCVALPSWLVWRVGRLAGRLPLLLTWLLPPWRLSPGLLPLWLSWPFSWALGYPRGSRMPSVPSGYISSIRRVCVNWQVGLCWGID